MAASKFYLTFPIRNALSTELSWTPHYSSTHHKNVLTANPPIILNDINVNDNKKILKVVKALKELYESILYHCITHYVQYFYDHCVVWTPQI